MATANTGQYATAPSAGPSSTRSRRILAFLWIALAAVVLVAHVRLVFGFLHWETAWSDRALWEVDWPLRIGAALESASHARAGGFSGYNPYLLAGVPRAGGSTDPLTLLLLALPWPVDPLRVFKLWTLAQYLLAPLLVAAAAGIASRRLSSVPLALTFAVVFWHTDSQSFVFRKIGSVFVGAACVVPLAVALALTLARAVEARHHRARSFVATVLMTVLALWFHPLTGAVFVAPALVIAVWALFRARPRDGVLLAVAAATIAALCTPWLLPLLRARAAVVTPGALDVANGQSRGLDLEVMLGGHGVTAVALAVLPLALVTLVRREQRLEAATWGSAVAASFALGNFGSQLGLTFLQPYRFCLTTATLAIPPVALLAIAGVSTGVRLAALAITAAVVSGLRVSPFPLGSRDWLLVPLVDRDANAEPVLDWIRQAPPEARFLIEEPNHPLPSRFRGYFLGLVPSRAGREMLNPDSPHRGLVAARFLFQSGSLGGKPLAEWSEEALGEFLERYGVTHVAAHTPEGKAGLARVTTVLSHEAAAGGYDFYRSRRPATRFLVGSGRVEADYSAIRVRGASPGTVVLRYHWAAGMRALPPLPVLRHPVPGDAAGFIEVHNGDCTDFDLVMRERD